MWETTKPCAMIGGALFGTHYLFWNTFWRLDSVIRVEEWRSGVEERSVPKGHEAFCIFGYENILMVF